MGKFQVPDLSRETIRKRAEAFLATHHSNRTLPVPIELIIERMGVDIVPLPNMKVDAFTTADLKEIWVEEFHYKNRPNRYRFSLAHELGHIEVHSQVFKAAGFTNLDQWKKFINSIPFNDYRTLEDQADAFAGYVLLPRKELLVEIEECKKVIQETSPDTLKDPASFRDFIAICIANKFEVSKQAASIQMSVEKVVID